MIENHCSRARALHEVMCTHITWRKATQPARMSHYLVMSPSNKQGALGQGQGLVVMVGKKSNSELSGPRALRPRQNGGRGRAEVQLEGRKRPGQADL